MALLRNLPRSKPAMAQGEVTPDEAATIASVFEIRRKAIETFEFEQRLTALEGRKDK